MEARITRIVVGFDFSMAARHAVEAAAAIAERGRAELVVVTSVPHLVDRAEAQRIVGRVGYEMSRLEAESFALTELEQDVRRVVATLDTRGVALLFDIGEKPPARMLARAAEDYDADLVVIGAVGREGDYERAVGIETMRLVRECPAPVLVVRRDRPFPPARILAATDLSEASRRALGWALQLAAMCAAEVEVLTVAATPEEVGAQQERARDLVLGLEPPAGLEWRVSARIGTAYEAIPLVAAEGGFDLVALGTLGRSALVEFLIGGTSERVLRALPASLLLAKPDTFALRKPTPRV